MKAFQSGIILGITVFILISCAPSMKYEAQQEVRIPGGIIVNATADADPQSGEMKVKATIKNGSSNGIILMREVAQLRSPEGYSVNPSTIEGSDFVLPGDQGQVIFSFVPINSTWLHQRAGWNGDMERVYELSLDFIQDSENQSLSSNYIKLEMPINKYRNYLNKKAIEPYLGMYKLYEPEIPQVYAMLEKNMKDNIPLNMPHMHGNESDPHMPEMRHTINISGQEFFLDGVIMKVSLYRIKKEATLFVRIINKKADELTLDLDKIWLEENGSKLRHKVVKTTMKEKGPKYVIRQNDRMEIYMEFDLKNEAPLLKVFLDGLRFMDKADYFTMGLTYTNEVMGLNE